MGVGSIQNKMSNAGLSEHEMALMLMVNVLRNHGSIRRAIEGVEDNLDVARIALELDDLGLPYRFDVSRLESIAFQPLKHYQIQYVRLFC